MTLRGWGRDPGVNRGARALATTGSTALVTAMVTDSWEGMKARAEAEYRDVLAARLRVLGPDHPSTQTTSRSLEYLARLKNP